MLKFSKECNKYALLISHIDVFFSIAYCHTCMCVFQNLICDKVSMLLRCKTQAILSHAFIDFKEFDTLILESFQQFSGTFVPLEWLFYDAIFSANKKFQYNNYNKKEVWLPNFFGSYFMMFSLHISIVSKSQNDETYAYSKYQPYIFEFHTVAMKSTSLRDVFQLSSHILCKA